MFLFLLFCFLIYVNFCIDSIIIFRQHLHDHFCFGFLFSFVIYVISCVIYLILVLLCLFFSVCLCYRESIFWLLINWKLKSLTWDLEQSHLQIKLNQWKQANEQVKILNDFKLNDNVRTCICILKTKKK